MPVVPHSLFFRSHAEKLRVIEQAEEAVRAQGFRVIRVRHHGDVARLEIARDEMTRALDPDVAAAIDAALRALGFRYVTWISRDTGSAV